ncbi:hypothetical protein CKAH01_00477 [Colletotrichum kahawae]|uniref:Uncharacterized protein n=1 Tax=Colletotrichum kahawae TaxID=34407 RepID=A0AAD9YYH4_COLKA|nr:hypothetical protein CKAH01_00477 [Colletotrichum kahawae]
MSNQSQCVNKIPFQTNLFSRFFPSRPVSFVYITTKPPPLALARQKRTPRTPFLSLAHHTHTSVPTTSRIRPASLALY